MPSCFVSTTLHHTWYPWGSGIFAISLGPQDGCVVVVNRIGEDGKGSGRRRSRGLMAAAIKELIETTKIAQCRGDHRLSRLIWFLIHHWPVNCYGQGPLLSSTAMTTCDG